MKLYGTLNKISERFAYIGVTDKNLTTIQYTGAANVGSVFLDDLKFEIIKRDLLYKAVLSETGFGVPLKFADITVEPNWFSKIKTEADLVKCLKNLMGPRFFTIINNNGIAQHMIFFPNFSP